MTDEELEQEPAPVIQRRPISRGTRMAKPISMPMELTEAPVVEPAVARRSAPPAAEPEPVPVPVPEPPMPEPPRPEPRPEPPPPMPEPARQPVAPAQPKAAAQPVPAPAPTPAPAPAAPKPPPAAPSPQAVDPDLPATTRETIQAVDQAWHAFRAVAARFPSERMDDRLGEGGWTVKQMLAHIAAWHDMTADRLIKFFGSGKPPEFDQDADRFNAMVARRAIGRTAGEVLNDVEVTFNRLRRQMQRLTDEQLHGHDSWAAWVIRGNTYGHYEEHWADIYTPEPLPGNGRR